MADVERVAVMGVCGCEEAPAVVGEGGWWDGAGGWSQRGWCQHCAIVFQIDSSDSRFKNFNHYIHVQDMQ